MENGAIVVYTSLTNLFLLSSDADLEFFTRLGVFIVGKDGFWEDLWGESEFPTG